jgi:hypothetical protein
MEEIGFRATILVHLPKSEIDSANRLLVHFRRRSLGLQGESSRRQFTSSLVLINASDPESDIKASREAHIESEGLKQLNRIAGRILDENLFAAVAGHDLIAEPCSRALKLCDSRFAILEFDLDSVPAAWSRLLTGWHSLSRAAGARPVEQQQISPDKLAKPGAGCIPSSKPSMSV